MPSCGRPSTPLVELPAGGSKRRTFCPDRIDDAGADARTSTGDDRSHDPTRCNRLDCC